MQQTRVLRNGVKISTLGRKFACSSHLFFAHYPLTIETVGTYQSKDPRVLLTTIDAALENGYRMIGKIRRGFFVWYCCMYMP